MRILTRQTRPSSPNAGLLLAGIGRLKASRDGDFVADLKERDVGWSSTPASHK